MYLSNAQSIVHNGCLENQKDKIEVPSSCLLFDKGLAVTCFTDDRISSDLLGTSVLPASTCMHDFCRIEHHLVQRPDALGGCTSSLFQPHGSVLVICNMQSGVCQSAVEA